MRFDFKFEFLLRHRKRLEEIARRDFLEARHALDQSLALIQSMYDAIDQIRAMIADLQTRGAAVDLQNIVESESFIEGQKIRIQRERQRARELMTVVETKQEILVEAAKDHKMIGKLKDRQKKEFVREKRKLEARQIDDLVVIRGNRGRIG